MSDRIVELQTGLRKQDLLGRIIAMSQESRSGNLLALPVLHEFVLDNSVRELEDVCFAVRCIGEILGRNFRETGIPSEFLRYYEFLLSELSQSVGVYSFSIIFGLCLVGPLMANSESQKLVAEAAIRSNDVNLHYGAFQYASVVNPLLLSREPWKRFVPPSDDLIQKWNIDENFAPFLESNVRGGGEKES